jgi:protein-tyrosine phosphatase
MIDIHNHILPGLDDGAKDFDEAVMLCELAAADGIEALVVTPHIRDGLYPNNRDSILKKTAELKDRLSGSCDIEIYAGAEVHLATNIIERIRSKSIMTINDNGYLLLELPEQVLPPRSVEFIFDLKLAGITPIIAHPERYGWVKNEADSLKRFVELGAFLQITAKSLTGGFGKEARSMANYLLKEQMVAVIASDSHSPRHRPAKLSDAVKEAAKVIGEDEAAKLVRENPKRIIKGENLAG